MWSSQWSKKKVSVAGLSLNMGTEQSCSSYGMIFFASTFHDAGISKGCLDDIFTFLIFFF